MIIRKTSGDKEYKPLATTGTKPTGHDYVGVLVASLDARKPFAAIMVRGTVNEAHCRYTVPTGAKTDLRLIRFIKE